MVLQSKDQRKRGDEKGGGKERVGVLSCSFFIRSCVIAQEEGVFELEFFLSVFREVRCLLSTTI